MGNTACWEAEWGDTVVTDWYLYQLRINEVVTAVGPFRYVHDCSNLDLGSNAQPIVRGLMHERGGKQATAA
jgi:hypothetical protein